jgi:hypothetical protein
LWSFTLNRKKSGTVSLSDTREGLSTFVWLITAHASVDATSVNQSFLMD